MKEEDDILRKVGTDNVFTLPEGYFENLTSEVMNKLPEKDALACRKRESTKWDRTKPYLYMAALFIGAALIIRVGTSLYKTDTDALVTTEEQTEADYTSDEYINAAVEGTMMDDYSLYVFLGDAEIE